MEHLFLGEHHRNTTIFLQQFKIVHLTCELILAILIDNATLPPTMCPHHRCISRWEYNNSYFCGSCYIFILVFPSELQ